MNKNINKFHIKFNETIIITVKYELYLKKLVFNI